MSTTVETQADLVQTVLAPAGGERVTFESGGETIVGRLFPAAFGDGPAPAVAIIGPMTFQKEQICEPQLLSERGPRATNSKAPARSSSTSAALGPAGLISAETRTLVARTPRHACRLGRRAPPRLRAASPRPRLGRCSPDDGRDIEAEVSAERVFHDPGVALVGPDCPDAGHT